MELTVMEDNSSKMPTSPWQSKGVDSGKDPKVQYCGIGLWRPSCLEPLRDIRAFLAAMCFVSCLQASYSGYTSSQITTIEKRFAIGSIVIGTINSFFEVGYVSCVMIVSYLGAKGRIPLWIACGLFAMACGAFLFSTPQFLFPYDSSFSSGNKEQLCSLDRSINNAFPKKSCNAKVDESYHFLPILLLAQFLIGAGSSPILTLAPPFVEDHVPPSKAPAMIASLYAAAALGPVFGYALGALMLQQPMDKWSKTKIIDNTLTPASKDWIGLWWAGYIFLGLGVFIGSCILTMFPRTLRSSFTPHKRSLESDMATGSSNSGGVVDGGLSDAKPNSSLDVKQPLSLPDFQAPLTSHQSYRQRASYQHHQRSFSGNVPFTTPTTAPPWGVGGTAQNTFYPSSKPHHQRSASVSSILLHAAIIAATASHAADEDEALHYTETETDNSSDESDSFPDESEKLNKRQSRIDRTMDESQRSRPLFRTSAYRSKSLSTRQHQQYSRRWTSAFWSSRSSSHGMSQQSASRLSRMSQTAKPLGVPPPILDVMVEDGTLDASMTSAPKVSENSTNSSDLDPNNNSALPIGVRRLHPPILEGDTHISTLSSNVNSGFRPPLPLAPTASTSKPSVFGHLHKRRKRRPRKIIRGRIFGFLADWSKDIPRSIFNLLKNKIYVVTCLCICCEMFIIIGFAGFLPKYMEIEYQISKATASMIVGGLIIPAGAFGILVGGLILNKARFSGRGAALFVFAINLFIVGSMSSFFFLGCQNPKIAGFTVPYPTGPFEAVNTNRSEILKPWEMACCRPCDCNAKAWKPVCHLKTNTIFISPCFAGCAKGPIFLSDSNQYVYHHCHCLRSFAVDSNSDFVSQRDTNAPSTLVGGKDAPLQIFDDEVYTGVCAPDCKKLVPFVCFLTVVLFLTGVIQNPLIMLTMRSVRHSQRSLALGLQFVIIRLLANLPSPIAFGRVIDGACLLWKDECGRRGDCALMDVKHLTQYITGLGVTVKGSSLLVYIVLIYMLSRKYSSAPDLSAEEEVEATKTSDDTAFQDGNQDTEDRADVKASAGRPDKPESA